MFLGRRTVKRSGEREGERERETDSEKGTKEEEKGCRRKRGRWTKEGAKPLADGGESLRRVAWQSYRRYHGGSSLFSLSPSSLYCLYLSLSLSLFLSLSFSLYTYVTTPRTQQPSWCIPVTLYTVRCNNVPTR